MSQFHAKVQLRGLTVCAARHAEEHPAFQSGAKGVCFFKVL